jgi:hypothetical protein
MACLAGLIWILWSVPAEAACSGSGTTWSCTAGSTSANIQSAVNSATDGFTITLADGAYTLSSFVQFSNTVGGTITCASVGGCTINSTSNTVFGSGNLNGVNTHFYRISGFIFDTGGSAPFAIIDWYNGGAGAVSTPGPNGVGGIRIDNNTFQNMGAGSNVIFFGEGGNIYNFYGVIDHNSVTNAGGVVFVQSMALTNPSPPSNQLGTVNNMFIEDNTITITTLSNASSAAVTDGWGGVGYVARHNTSTNILWAAHGATHTGGPANYEFYDNSVSMNSGAVGAGVSDCYRCFHHQGSGTGMYFDNSFTNYPPSGKNGEVISMADYRAYANGPSIDGGVAACDGNGVNFNVGGGLKASDGNRAPSGSNYGYPCWHQPGRDFAANIVPMYTWNNFWSDTHAKVDFVVPDFGSVVPNGSFPPNNCNASSSGNCDYLSFQFISGRDYYNAVSALAQTSPTSPFNGTTGVGFGTLANRPTSCTSDATENAFGHGTTGVGYFATDQGAQGTFYQCSATNTWTVWYTPYTYPHPLTTGDPQPPAPPTGLQAVVN